MESSRTFLCREHGGDRAEGPLPSVVERPHFHVKRRERWDGVVAEVVPIHAGGGDHRPGPRDRARGSEGDDVPEALSVLQLLGNGLGAKHTTIVILKRIQTEKQTGPSLRCPCTRSSGIRHRHPETLSNHLPPYLLLLRGHVIVAKVQNSSEQVLSCTRWLSPEERWLAIMWAIKLLRSILHN